MHNLREFPIKHILNFRLPYLFGVLACFIVALLSLLLWEYRSLRTQTDKIYELQDQYYGYIDTMKKILRKKKVDDECQEDEQDDESDENDDLEVDSFIVINREPSYLKQSTVAYLKEQRLESLLNRMNLQELKSYTDHVIENDTQPKQKRASKRTRTRTAKVRRNVESRRQARWLVNRRESITGIEFVWPIPKDKFWLSSFYGSRKKPNGRWGFHYGIDMAAPRGTPVYASAAGVVEFAGRARGYGNTVVIAHDSHYKTRYAHLDSIATRVHKKVNVGDKIGAVGDTGFTIKSGKDASHLHFELYEQGVKINPLCLLPR